MKLQMIALRIRFRHPALRLLLSRHLPINIKRFQLDLDEVDSFPLLFNLISSKTAALDEFKFKLWPSSIFEILRNNHSHNAKDILFP